jgi:hypothetical protein
LRVPLWVLAFDWGTKRHPIGRVNIWILLRMSPVVLLIALSCQEAEARPPMVQALENLERASVLLQQPKSGDKRQRHSAARSDSVREGSAD